MIERPRARRSPLHILPAFVAGIFFAAAPSSALAGEEGAAFFFDAFATMGNVHEHSLHVAALVTEPDPLKDRNLLLDGPGGFFGGGFHFVILGPEARGGMGLGIYGMEGMKLRHDPLPPGLTPSIGTAWGMSIDAFVGRELVKGPVYPYVDLRAVLNVMQAGIQLNHPAYGVLGETAYNAYGFGIGPRIGVSIPLGDPWVIDISGYYGLFGAERATIVASIGFWDH
jgi:hypothetical protein